MSTHNGTPEDPDHKTLAQGRRGHTLTLIAASGAEGPTIADVHPPHNVIQKTQIETGHSFTRWLCAPAPTGRIGDQQ